MLAQHSVERLPAPINTDEYDEICPVMSYGEKYLFYTKVGSPDFIKVLIENDEDISTTRSEEDYNNRLKDIYSLISGKYVLEPSKTSYNQDIWYCGLDGEKINYPLHPGTPINNALPNSICSNYNKDNTFVIINQFGEKGGMSAGFSKVTFNKNETFSFPIPIEIKDLELYGSDINLAMSADAQHIFLAMKGRDSFGDQDIYLSLKLLENLYSKPINIGSVINTRFREATPYISQDKTKLYFSSNRPGGVGGMDIYVCERLDYSYQNWSEPRLIGQPINSTADDSHPYIALDSDQIYFSTNRDGTSDIYTAKMIRDTSLYSEVKINILAINSKTNKPMPATINWGPGYEAGYDNFFNSRDGKLEYTFKNSNPIKFMAQNRGILSQIELIDPLELSMEGINEVDLILTMTSSGKQKFVVKKRKRPEEIKPVLVGIEKDLTDKKTVVLKSIKFVRAKPDVLEESFPALEELASVLARRQDLRLRIEGHTDNNGNKDLLLKLSQDRADAIKIILIRKGALESQIETKGYGHTRPLNGNRNESERKANRRVEITILEQEEVIKEVDPVIKEIEKDLVDSKLLSFENIKFVRATMDVRKESLPILDKLASLLKRRSDLRIQIEGHTDNNGHKGTLLKLSQERAEAVKVILIEKGALESQIKTKGYGHTRPLNENSNGAEKEVNRRVEITILEEK